MLVLIAALALAYSNSFEGEFIFDDKAAIVDNVSIRSLWPPLAALWPNTEVGSTTEGRPLVNLSLAVNYAIGGTDVTGYHVFNLIVHVLATLTLFGLVRHTARLVLGAAASPEPETANRATALAFSVALLWGLHPLQTESVTYVVQRAESMVSCFYLLVLYCVARGEASEQPSRWRLGAFLACAAGMATKEVMVTAPVVAALYLWTLTKESPWRLIARRCRLWTALASTWLLLAVLVIAAKGRGGTAGFHEDLGPLEYFSMQWVVVLYYLKLCFLPFPLVLDYGVGIVKDPVQIGIAGTIVALLIGGSVWALFRRSWLGFLGCTFFLILSPSSSIVPILTQPMAEHRMYLPLACVMAVVVLGFDWSWRRIAAKGLSDWMAWVPTGLLGVMALTMGAQTWARNLDYRTAISIWQDTVAKRPDNSRAHRQMSEQYYKAGDVPSALAHSSLAIEVHPTSRFPPYDRGVLYMQLKDHSRALRDFDRALAIDPTFAEAWNNRGVSFRLLGAHKEAIESFTKAIEHKPWWGLPYANRALSRWDLGQHAEAQQDAKKSLDSEGMNDELRRIMKELLAKPVSSDPTPATPAKDEP